MFRKAEQKRVRLMNYYYAKLRGRIRELYGSERKFAVALGMSTGALSARLNGVSGFRQREIEESCRLLNIPLKEIEAYFFVSKVQKN